MKILNSTKEGVWNMSIPYTYTEEEKLILKNGTAEQKKVLMQTVAITNTNLQASEEDIFGAETMYTIHKPQLEPEDVYELKSFQVFVPDSGDPRINFIYKLNNKEFTKLV